MEVTAENENLVHQLRDQQRVLETRKILAVIANMAMPLYLGFWVVDVLYVPHLKWEFLILRLGTIPVAFLMRYLANHARNGVESQRVSLLFMVILSCAINYMIFRIGDPTTCYYAGLNLIALGNLAFLPWQNHYFAVTAALMYLPYWVITGFQVTNVEQLNGLAINSFFNIGTIVIMYFTRQFNEALRASELKSQLALQGEIRNREEIIQAKTKEAIRLEGMSRQFSPQVLEAIKSGKIEINQQVHRAKICAVFIDIVSSTERVTRIDKDKVQKVIAMFMEDTIKTLLKYDLTVDKFLGDGVLAFGNHPIQHHDYAFRAISAALEIKEKIAKRQFVYENYWRNELQIRIGIADGPADVGFYGNEKYYHAYTAIGPVMNLASRLCASAEPNQILVTYDVLEQVDIERMEWEQLGKRTFKGFEQDVIKVYAIKAMKEKSAHLDTPECPSCGTIMYLETNADGIFDFKCRSCGSASSSDPKAA